MTEEVFVVIVEDLNGGPYVVDHEMHQALVENGAAHFHTDGKECQ